MLCYAVLRVCIYHIYMRAYRGKNELSSSASCLPLSMRGFWVGVGLGLRRRERRKVESRDRRATGMLLCRIDALRQYILGAGA